MIFINNSEFFDVYLADMSEHLELLNESLLKLDKAYDDKETINAIFRAFHTMKGSTAAMSFNQTADKIHRMEDLLSEMREGRIKANSEIINLLFLCHDFIEKFIDIISKTEDEKGIECQNIMEELEHFIQNKATKADIPKIPLKEKDMKPEDFFITSEELDYLEKNLPSKLKAYKVNLKIAEDCVFKTIRAWMAFNELDANGEVIKASPQRPTSENFEDNAFVFPGNEIEAIIISEKKATEIKKHLNNTLMEMEYIGIEESDPSYETTRNIVNNIIEFENENGNEAEVNVDREFEGNSLKLGEILVQRGVMDQQSVNDMLKKQQESYLDEKLGQIIIKEEKASLTEVALALELQADNKAHQKNHSFIRIPEQKADSLVDMLGELLIIQSLHKQEIIDLLREENRGDNGLISNITRMERITKDIQTISMSLRMVSLKQSFQKLARIGHDTALELEKNINITLIGEDTEIDRSVVEKIQDPLMHLVRNSISHGIESPEDRVKGGKPKEGQVQIRAYNKRGFVFIEIFDDGKGLSVEKIYEKAKEKNLIDTSRSYTEEEIIKFIYLPGFSTQESINNVSGRGVGMNVVETEILKIGGKIEISNKPNCSCTFTLKIPINLATINGTIVEIFGERYILPTLNIKQLLKPDKSQWISIKGKADMIKIRDEIIQVIPIDKILNANGKSINYEDGMVIVIESEHRLKALPIRTVAGKQEIVVKPLGVEFRSLDFASGATILGDGKVSLILDVESMFKN